jgi:hypothetical protein
MKTTITRMGQQPDLRIKFSSSYAAAAFRMAFM